MSLGLGVFFSTVTISMLLLYRFTYERWNWATIARRFGYTIGGLIGAVIVVSGGVWVYSNVLPPPRPTAYAELKLGMSMDEVQYIKGLPNYVLGPTIAKSQDDEFAGFQKFVKVGDIEKGKSILDFSDWAYGGTENGSRVDVSYGPDNKVNSVICYSQRSYDCASLLGVAHGTSEDAVVERLGKPSLQLLNGVTKSIWYERYNTIYRFEKKRVYMMGLSTDPNTHGN